MTPPQDTVYPENLEKPCTKCGKSKQLDSFYRHKRGLYGRQSWCKVCFDAHNEELKQKNIRNRENIPQTEFKICSRIDCDHSGIMQPISNFTKNTKSKDGFAPECKTCTRKQSAQWRSANLEKKRASDKRWKDNNPEKDRKNRKDYYERNKKKIIELHKLWNLDNPDKLKEYSNRRSIKDREKVNARSRARYELLKISQWAKLAEYRCNERARKKGLPYGMKEEDLVDPVTGKLPIYCPIFPSIKLDYLSGPNRREWATVDRKIPELGYVRGNVWVVSWIANACKSNGGTLADKKIINKLICHSKVDKRESETQQSFLF